MRSFEKDIIFWHGLNNIAGEDFKLKYMITTEKDYLVSLANVTFLGLHQYSLATGSSLKIIEDTEAMKYSAYILQNYDKLYKLRYRQYQEKPVKIKVTDEDDAKKAKEFIEQLLIPYFNQYCFKTLAAWREVVPTYIAALIFTYEFDINHEADDKKLKTSSLYPFLFTLNLINIRDHENLYKRVRLYFDRKKILRKYNSGRAWKDKEKVYLSDTVSLLENEEEWNVFIANFAYDKWKDFDMSERFKTLFQLSKVVCMLMKDEITSVTMLGNGDEPWDILHDYLPLFIYEDKIITENNTISSDIINEYAKTCSPFAFMYLNSAALIDYVGTKENHLPVDEKLIKTTDEIIWTILVKLRILKLTHDYLPEIVNIQIEQKKKLWVDILHLFSPGEKDGKYKANNMNEHDISNFFFLEEEIIELKNLNENDKTFFSSPVLFKLAKGVSFLVGLNAPTAGLFDYNLKEILKYVFTILGPHPSDRTIVTQEFLDLAWSKFSHILEWYGSLSSITKDTYKSFFELPYRLLNWKK